MSTVKAIVPFLFAMPLIFSAVSANADSVFPTQVIATTSIVREAGPDSGGYSTIRNHGESLIRLVQDTGFYKTKAVVTEQPSALSQLTILGSPVQGINFHIVTSSFLQYYVGVSGGGGVVPIRYTGIASAVSYASPGTGFISNAYVTLGDRFGAFQNSYNACSGSPLYLAASCYYSQGSYVPIEGEVNVFASDQNYIVVSIESVVEGNGYGAGSAFADPIFIIDPLFLATNPGYSLHFSDFIQNTTASVPEPNTWALMIGGFGLAGGLVRRRRAIAAASALAL